MKLEETKLTTITTTTTEQSPTTKRRREKDRERENQQKRNTANSQSKPTQSPDTPFYISVTTDYCFLSNSYTQKKKTKITHLTLSSQHSLLFTPRADSVHGYSSSFCSFLAHSLTFLIPMCSQFCFVFSFNFRFSISDSIPFHIYFVFLTIVLFTPLFSP